MSATARQVLESLLEGVAPERYPNTASVFSVCSRRAGYTYEQFMQLTPLEQAQFEYNAAREHGTDQLSGSLSGTLLTEALGGKIKYRAHGSPDVAEPLIGHVSEIDSIDISRIRVYPHYLESLETTRYLFDLGGEEFNHYVHTWGVFTQAGLFYGEENLMRACLRDKPAVNALLDFCFEVFKYTQEEFLDAGATIGSCADPTASGDMISKRVFEEFAAPYLQKVNDWYKSKGVHTSLHICGDINDRIDLMPDIHVDILSVDQKVDIVRGAQILDGRLAIGGNADPVSVIMDQSPGEVRACYEALIEQLEDYPYILMPGCSVSTLTPLENILAIIEAAHGSRPLCAVKQ